MSFVRSGCAGDSLTRTTSLIFTETLTITDTLLKQLSRLFTESISLSDTVETIRFYARTFSESITMSDTLSRFTSKLLSETATLTDTLSRGLSRLLLESFTVSDGSGSTFDPHAYGTVDVWLDAAQITGISNGNPVSTWPDKSGNGNDATVVGTFTAPTYETGVLNGNPVVQFVAASNQALRAFYTQVGGGNAAFTAFVVARLNGTTNARVFGSIYPDNSNWLCGWWNTEEDVAYFNGGFAGPQNAADTTWKQYTGKGDGVSTGYLYSSGTLLSPTGSAIGNPNGAIALSG